MYDDESFSSGAACAVRLVDGRESVDADANSDRYERWAELDFNNEPKGDRRKRQYGREQQSQT
jgi:hypothetical protein